jgi:succinate dehydrogenase / fumarate reductase cytochrome b subunit|tara:strand:- start:56 stop:475 length:420 start_codon:yes stop_codon:yes gene_type:complete
VSVLIVEEVHMQNPDRPLSPHLSVYRWQISNGLSILHRITGFVLATGAFLFTLWILSAVVSAEYYDGVMAILSSGFGLLIMFGYTFCFYYHLCNGIRHLGWDVGKGFEKATAVKTGIAVVVVSSALTLGSWAILMGGAA